MKIFDENAGFVQSMKRQFEFLNHDFDLLHEKCFILTEINNIVCRKKMKASLSPRTLSHKLTITKGSYFNFNDLPATSLEMKRDSIINCDTPLLDSLMKRKRIKEYKERTMLIQGGQKKYEKDN